ncbi:MAG: hypothetical protein HXL03_03310 [Candidatus Nanosynbacter sp.]|nr:hypothetical protein [Candidatus Nanosynbacter sp.]
MGLRIIEANIPLKAGQPLLWRTELAKISQYAKKKRRPIYQNNFPGTFLMKTNGRFLKVL